jgi:hypothetical protein
MINKMTKLLWIGRVAIKPTLLANCALWGFNTNY